MVGIVGRGVRPGLAALLAAAIGGCSGAPTDDRPLQSVTGQVTLDGQPLARGLIRFEPSSPEATTAGGATIDQGQFALDRDAGLVPGNYRVSITGLGPETPAPANEGEQAPGPETGKAPLKEPIPARYNVQSTLTAEVGGDRDNTFEFTLTSK
jgi:hypothetical protein